jgi:hypothetical protein
MPEAVRRVIEHDIPLPGKLTGRRDGPWVTLATGMEIGDSVALTGVGQVHALFLALKRIGKQGTSRQLDAEHWRVWCIKPRKA